jgi:hypothetical protein
MFIGMGIIAIVARATSRFFKYQLPCLACQT